MSKLADIARRAGRWLGLAATPKPAPPAVRAIVADRFDALTWQETYDQSGKLQDLADELSGRYDYVNDLLADVFQAAIKGRPRLREAAEMDPSRAANHAIVAAMIDAPELAEVRRETAGDPYAAALAVLAQATGLRRALERSQATREAAAAAAATREQARSAAQGVADAVATASETVGDDGEITPGAEQAIAVAIAAAEAAQAEADAQAEAAATTLAQAAPGIGTATRSALAAAADEARTAAQLTAAWGVSPGALARMGYAERAALAARLSSARLSRFADLIGRFRQLASGERARHIEHGTGELVGVTLGNDLSSLIPSEAAMLGVPALRAAFLARYTEGRLMIHQQRGEAEAGRGAIIACVDCSASMQKRDASGITREAWAKALALALLDQAHAGGRDFVGIHFASAGEVRAFRFPATRPVDLAEVLDFAELFFNGGTDFAAPLTAAVDILDQDYDQAGRQRGDIVMITDGEAPLADPWLADWHGAKTRLGFRSFGVAVQTRPAATAPGSPLDQVCDSVRTVADLAPDAAAGMFRII